MTQKTTTRERLTAEEFKTALNDKDFKLLNGIKYAHGTNQSEFKIAFGHYPEQYLVDEEQINTAKYFMLKEERNKKSQYLKDKVLVFNAMGMSFKTDGDFIGNHRIRASFLNSDGIKCFIEVGTARQNDLMRCDHAIFNICDKWTSLKERDRMEKNNYNNLERGTGYLKYTFTNLLNLVNKNFNCNFKKIVLEEYFLKTDVFTSISPLKEVTQ